jgi:hypothetical protein
MKKLALTPFVFVAFIASAQVVVQDSCVTSPLGKNAKPIEEMTSALQNSVDQAKVVNSDCFDPLTDPRIQEYFKPNQFGDKGRVKCELHETEESMKRMHQKVLARCKEYGIDPRLVYLTTIGESRANPFIQQGQKSSCPSSLNQLKVGPGRAFSMFQFYGGSNARLVLNEMIKVAAENPPSRGMREVVFDYYFDHYMKRAEDFFKNKCQKKKSNEPCRLFSELTPIEQLAKLDLGNINPGTVNALKGKLVSGSYRHTKGYDLFYEAVGGTAMVPDASGKKMIQKTYVKKPICGDQ